MSAHASLATSGCQSLSFVGESVSHQVSTPAKSTRKMTNLRKNGLTNRRTMTKLVATSAAAIRLPAPNGASYHAAPNAHAIAMLASGTSRINLIAAINRERLMCRCFDDWWISDVNARSGPVQQSLGEVH